LRDVCDYLTVDNLALNTTQPQISVPQYRRNIAVVVPKFKHE